MHSKAFCGCVSFSDPSVRSGGSNDWFLVGVIQLHGYCVLTKLSIQGIQRGCGCVDTVPYFWFVLLALAWIPLTLL